MPAGAFLHRPAGFANPRRPGLKPLLTQALQPRPTIAARLYHSLGFDQVGVRRGYYQSATGREDAAVLRRTLFPEHK